jgi:hypothetical protein
MIFECYRVGCVSKPQVVCGKFPPEKGLFRITLRDEWRRLCRSSGRVGGGGKSDCPRTTGDDAREGAFGT